MDLPFVAETYQASTPDLAPVDVLRAFEAALNRARAKHLDFDRFLPGIEFLSRVVFAAHHGIPLDDFIETLYCAVKHGDFTRSWRTQLRQTAQPTQV